MSEEEMKSVKFLPLFDNVLLQAIPEKTSKSGLEIPKMAQEKILVRAKVIAVGPGKLDLVTRERVPMALKQGDIVYINTYLGMKIKSDPRTEFLVQKEDEIRIVENEAVPSGV